MCMLYLLLIFQLHIYVHLENPLINDNQTTQKCKNKQKYNQDRLCDRS